MSSTPAPTAVFQHFKDLLPWHWQRRRGTLGPAQVLLTLMNMSVMGEKGYARTLDELKRTLGKTLDWEEHRPSEQALSQARRKLSSEVCREVVSQVRSLCTTARTHAAFGYGEFRLLAIDGTKLALPAYKALRVHFGCPKQSPQGPQASLTLLWDVGANQPVDWRVDPYRTCERVHARQFVAQLGPGDLVLGDRNFPSRRMLFELHGRGADWLMRVRSAGSGTLAEVSAFVASGAADAPGVLVERDHHGNPRPGAPSLTVRFLRKVLKDGSVAVFITSLIDVSMHPTQVLIELYAARWKIETAFRELKIWHGLERFHARYVDGIAQEIAVLMLFQLLSSELEAQARIRLKADHPAVPTADAAPADQRTLRFNRRTVAYRATLLLAAGMIGRAQVRKEFEDSLQEIWRSRQMVTSRRSFPRERKSPARGWRPNGKHGH